MTVILYFTTFAAVLVLFASALAAIGWILFMSMAIIAGLHRRMTEPEARPRRTSHPSLNPNHLKRAGQ
jgi:hypothetical protein